MRPRITLTPGAGNSLPVRSVHVQRSLAWPVGRAKAWLPAGVTPPALGEEARIEASDGEASHPLLTGNVFRVDTGFDGTMVMVLEPSKVLADLRVDRSWQSTSLGDVITQLATENGLNTGTMEPGLNLPSLTMVRQRSVLDHLKRLVKSAGLCLYVDRHGKIQAVTPNAIPGALSLSPRQALARLHGSRRNGPSALTVRGEGALGVKGPGTESWLLADPNNMTDGDAGDPGKLYQRGVLKSMAEVGNMRMAEETRLAEARVPVELTLAQVVDVDLMDTIFLSGFDADISGSARLVGLDAGYDGQSGFVVRLRMHKIS